VAFAGVIRWLAVCLVAAALIALPSSAVATSGPAVRGGGVVDGPLGSTSQLGFTATSSGGSFLCVMAGRSGGFPFGPWESIQQMHVQGRVTPGTLSITDDVATFSGTATIHVVGTTSTGRLAMTLSDVPFTSTQAAGGAGVAWHRLDVSGVGTFGPETMKTGRITIWP
jgi:hypothetical protein